MNSSLLALLLVSLLCVCGATCAEPAKEKKPNFSMPRGPSPNYLFEQGENDTRAALIKGNLIPHGGAAIRWFNMGIKVAGDMIPEPTEQELSDPEPWETMAAAKRWLCIDVVKFRNTENMYSPIEDPGDDRYITPEMEQQLRTFALANPTDEKVSRQCFEYKEKDDMLCASAKLLNEGEEAGEFVGARIGVGCGFEDYECQFSSVEFGIFLSIEPRDLCALISDAKAQEAKAKATKPAAEDSSSSNKQEL